MSRNALLALIKRGVVAPWQAAQFAPMRIPRQVLDAPPVQRFVAALKADGRFPKGGCPDGQQALLPEETPQMKLGAL